MNTDFRVTHRAMATRSLDGLQANLERLQRIQQRLSSGREISRPSDSPVATVSAMQLRSGQQRTEQYARNAQDGLGWLGTADTALTTVLGSVRRVREITAQAINGAIGADARAAMAAEVDELRKDLLALANTRYLDRPVFAGTAPVATAYDGSGAYQGDTNVVRRTVAPGTEVEVSVPGTTVFGPAGADLFALVAGIADDLRNDPGNLGTRLGQLDTRVETVQDQLSAVGAKYNRVDTMRTMNDDRGAALAQSLSAVEGVDIPKTIMELQLQQVAYQAALGATARVIGPTLMDFLR